jgi:AcrR family transcriptional regulator
MAGPTPTTAHDDRREALLHAAVGVFFRYGLHKTSMDDVARAAGISRQGLYRHFASKDELFGETVRFVVAHAEEKAVAALDDDELPLPARLEAAFLAWSGLHFSHMSTSAHVAEILAAANAPLGRAFEDARRRFGEAIARALRRAGVASTAKEARERALTLEAAATGLKHTAPDQSTFLRDVRVCIRVVVVDGGGS